MVWAELLLVGALGLAGPAFPTLVASCDTFDKATTGCINGDVVEVETSTTSPGTPGGGGPGSSTGTGGSSGPPVIWKCMEVTCAEDSPGAEPITLSDIASFRPTPGVEFMQPNGWTVPGLPTNIYAVSSTHIKDGELLGQPASVRFTPVAFHWSYGDGTTATKPTAGNTWQAYGIPEFDPTPTSHVYAVEGTYTITLTIDFRAEYRFAGSGFTPIAGVIPVPANPLQITVDGAKTVLVEDDCNVNPSGPGC